jgi:putative hydrolase of the HAD superfamily
LLKRESSNPDNVVYVGDDPRKDFRGIRPLGFRTIRVGTGRCADIEVAPGIDAEIRVERLRDIIGIVADWEDERR